MSARPAGEDDPREWDKLFPFVEAAILEALARHPVLRQLSTLDARNAAYSGGWAALNAVSGSGAAMVLAHARGVAEYRRRILEDAGRG